MGEFWVSPVPDLVVTENEDCFTVAVTTIIERPGLSPIQRPGTQEVFERVEGVPAFQRDGEDFVAARHEDNPVISRPSMQT